MDINIGSLRLQNPPWVWGSKSHKMKSPLKQWRCRLPSIQVRVFLLVMHQSHLSYICKKHDDRVKWQLGGNCINTESYLVAQVRLSEIWLIPLCITFIVLKATCMNKATTLLSTHERYLPANKFLCVRTNISFMLLLPGCCKKSNI